MTTKHATPPQQQRSGSIHQNVIHYVLSRLRQLGIADIFGVPGDYAFPIDDAIAEDRDVRWIGCCNELNAAYAADGYARIKGVAAVSTTYAVGELSALNALAGAYAEHLPVFHLVGMPNRTTQRARALVHYTLGNGEFDLFYRMTEPVGCAPLWLDARALAARAYPCHFPDAPVFPNPFTTKTTAQVCGYEPEALSRDRPQRRNR